MPTLDPNEHDERILYWNKVYRGALLFLVILVVAAVGFSAIKLNENTKQLKTLVVSNQKSSVNARKTLTGYIKCLSLLRFDDPELLKPDVTRQQVSDALDKCAVKE